MLDVMDSGDMGISTQLLRWWKSKWVGGYKNFQGMVEKNSDTEDLLQSDSGSLIRGGRQGVYPDTPLSRLSSHHECEDLGGFGSAIPSMRERQRCNSTGAVERVGVREGILVDLLGSHGDENDANRGFCANDKNAYRSCYGNQEDASFHRNQEDAYRGFYGNGQDAVDGHVLRHLRSETCDSIGMDRERKDPTYDVTMRQTSTGGLEKKKRKEFALTLYDLDGRGQLNRSDIESLVNKMLETLQANKPASPQHQSELPTHQRETKDNSTASGQHRSKTIRINFSISPQSTLGKPSPEGTLESPHKVHNRTKGIDSEAFKEEGFIVNSNGVNSNNQSQLHRLGNSRCSISTEDLIPRSPDCTRRRTRSILMNERDTVGEHLRRKLLKVAGQGESEKENHSPNVNTTSLHGVSSSGFSPDLNGGVPRTAVKTNPQSNNCEKDNSSSGFSNFAKSGAAPVVSPGKRRVQCDSRTSAKGLIGSSTIQNLLSARKTCVLPASAGKLSLLNGNGKFSYEKLEDGGYYSGFGVLQGSSLGTKPETKSEPARTIPNDRVPTEGLPCFENEYIEPSLAGVANRSRPPCLLPWEQSNDTQNFSDSGAPLTPKAPHVPSSFVKPNSQFARAQLDLPSNVQTASAAGLPRVLRNRRSAAGVGGRRLRRRHSLSAALSPMLWSPVEDREADVSADQSADEESDDSEFGTAKHFGALGISPIRNTNEPRWRRKRSSGLLQRQELLQIIRANMEKNKSCFLQPRRKATFHHHHHPSSQLPFPYNQHPTLPPTCEHPSDDLPSALPRSLSQPSQQHRRYTTNSILSQPELIPASTRNAMKFSTRNVPGKFPSSRVQSQQDLSYQFEQHQEKLNSRQQKRSRLDRPANVGELTVANVTAKELEHKKEFKEYIPIPVISIAEPNRPMPSRPAMNNGPSRLPNIAQDLSQQYHQKKPSPTYQQHRYKQSSRSKQQRRNHSFHFNKSDFVAADVVDLDARKSPLDCAIYKNSSGKLTKNRSFHCTTVESPETTAPDGKLANIRRHFVSPKLGKAKPVPSPPSEKDPIYDEINLAESRRLEQELPFPTQPLYCARKEKYVPKEKFVAKDKFVPKDKFFPKDPQEPVQCFNLKLNENNRIVFDDSMLPDTLNDLGKKCPPGNEKTFVYKQRLHASPSTQQKILRRSKSGLIETENSVSEDLISKTKKMSLDGKLPEEKRPSVEERLYGVASPGPRPRHDSPKKASRFYKHCNLDKLKPQRKSKQTEENVAKTFENLAKNEPVPPTLANRGEVKQSRVVRNLKASLSSPQIGEQTCAKTDGGRQTFPDASEKTDSGVLKTNNQMEGANESGDSSEVGGASDVSKVAQVGGVINNNIYINTREHHLCCINVLEHTLCCHSNVSHDQFCCQGNRQCKQACDPSSCHVNRKCKQSSERSTLSPCESSGTSHSGGDIATLPLGVPPVTRPLGNTASQSLVPAPTVNFPPPPPASKPAKLCPHGHVRKHVPGAARCSLHYLKHKYRDENEKLAREQVIKWLENDFTVEDETDGALSVEIDGTPEALSDEDCLISESESEGQRRVQLHKHVHHHFYHFDSVLV